MLQRLSQVSAEYFKARQNQRLYLKMRGSNAKSSFSAFLMISFIWDDLGSPRSFYHEVKSLKALAAQQTQGEDH